jgi:RNase P/RNase MRP subunit POP5
MLEKSKNNYGEESINICNVKLIYYMKMYFM